VSASAGRLISYWTGPSALKRLGHRQPHEQDAGEAESATARRREAETCDPHDKTHHKGSAGISHIADQPPDAEEFPSSFRRCEVRAENLHDPRSEAVADTRQHGHENVTVHLGGRRRIKSPMVSVSKLGTLAHFRPHRSMT